MGHGPYADAGAAADLITDYLALAATIEGPACGVPVDSGEAACLGPLRYEEAAHAYVDLLAGSGLTSDRAVSLLGHGDARVRGRAILALLGHGDEVWVTQALGQAASFALPWIVTP